MNFRPFLLMMTGLAMVLTGALDAWVKGLPSVDASQRFKLTATLTKHDQTDKLEKQLNDQKIPNHVQRGIQSNHFTKRGFRVVYQNSPDLVQAIYKGLRQSHDPVQLVSLKAGSQPEITADVTQLQYGPIYATRPAAAAAQKHLQDGKGYVFNIVDAYKKGSGKVDTVEIANLDGQTVQKCKTILKDLKIPDSAFVVENVPLP